MRSQAGDEHGLQAFLNGLLGFQNHPVHEVLARRNVADEANHLARGPNATLSVAILLRIAASRARNELSNVWELEVHAFLLFDPRHLGRHLVLHDASSVVQLPEHKHGGTLVRIEHLPLERIGPIALLCGAEARPTIDPISTKRECRRKPDLVLRTFQLAQERAAEARGLGEVHVLPSLAQGKQRQLALVDTLGRGRRAALLDGPQECLNSRGLHVLGRRRNHSGKTFG
mmetsp:Transcript_84932/g.237008  ORF Transcript_84932/g.237008 Transcript_84932/m.237008 type:complete len:229 (+) Transcript_84932:115-801(+)